MPTKPRFHAAPERSRDRSDDGARDGRTDLPNLRQANLRQRSIAVDAAGIAFALAMSPDERELSRSRHLGAMRECVELAEALHAALYDKPGPKAGTEAAEHFCYDLWDAIAEGVRMDVSKDAAMLVRDALARLGK